MYCRACGAELFGEANFCPACGVRVSEVKPVEKHHVFKVAGKPKLVLTNAAPGSVDIKSGSKKGEVTVDLDLRVPQHLECSVSQDKNVVTVVCRVKAGGWWWPSYFFRSGPTVNVSVVVPSEADLDVENRAGHIVVEGVKGAVTAESSAGRVNIRNCAGSVKTRTRAGSVTLEGIDGTVTARSSAGSVTFSGVLSKGENWFRTSVGSIDISLRGKPDLTVKASTRLGSIRCIPELADAYRGRGYYTGSIGDGAGRLIAETKTGSITIRH